TVAAEAMGRIPDRHRDAVARAARAVRADPGRHPASPDGPGREPRGRGVLDRTDAASGPRDEQRRPRSGHIRSVTSFRDHFASAAPAYAAFRPRYPAALFGSAYRTIDFPFAELALPAITMEAELTLEELGGYLGTWSAVLGYRSARGNDPVAPLLDRLRGAWGGAQRRRPARWPLALRV